MKKFLPIIFILPVIVASYGQNKTLGVGISTPNPNAALHVESPTGNQGFIMPRLTTAQRTATAFQSGLTAAENGLLVYDTDLKNIFIWIGTAWVSSAKPTFPFGEIVDNTLPNSSLFRLVNSGTTTGNFGVAAFENTNPNSGFSTLYASTNGSVNGVADFVVNNPLNNNDGIGVTTNGIGTAGNFTVNNTANAQAAVIARTNGTGVGLYGISTGTGGAIQGYTATGGAAIVGTHDGSGNGFAGLFQNTNAANAYPAVQANTLGTGPGVRVLQNLTSMGSGIDVNLQNTTSTAIGLSVTQQGLGSAGNFIVNNAANGLPAFYSMTSGTGVVGQFVKNGSGNAAAILAESNSNGAAGAFVINNVSSNQSAIYSTTNGTGSILFANHTGASGDIGVFQSASLNVARIDKTGKGFFNGGTQTGGADVAELFDVEGNKNEYEPGDVLVISEETDRTVEKSSSANSTKVAGVYATKPGVILTEKGIDENLDQLVPMGVIGVIPTKVCNENGAIKRGDLLVTSSTPGHAMKAISTHGNGIFPAGAIIGKALENFDGLEGKVNVLVNVK